MGSGLAQEKGLGEAMIIVPPSDMDSSPTKLFYVLPQQFLVSPGAVTSRPPRWKMAQVIMYP